MTGLSLKLLEVTGKALGSIYRAPHRWRKSDLRVFTKRAHIIRIAFALAFMVAGCTPQQPPTITQSESGCTLEPDDVSVSSGQVPITAANETDARLGFHLWRIEEGHTYEEFAAHIEEERRLALAGDPGLGPPTYAVDLIEISAQPGESEITVELTEGMYAVVCFEEYPQAGFRPSALLGPLQVE